MSRATRQPAVPPMNPAMIRASSIPVSSPPTTIPMTRRRGHREHLTPPAAGNQSRQYCQPQPVARLVADPADLAAKHRVLVPEHQELGVLGHLVPGQHHQAAEQTTNEQVNDRNDHLAMIQPGSPSRPRSGNRAPQVARDARAPHRPGRPRPAGSFAYAHYGSGRSSATSAAGPLRLRRRVPWGLPGRRRTLGAPAPPPSPRQGISEDTAGTPPRLSERSAGPKGSSRTGPGWPTAIAV